MLASTCGFARLSRDEATLLLKGSWVMLAEDSQARLLRLALLRLLLDPAPAPSMRQPTTGGDAGFVRADQIDLKSLDEQLERHLDRPAERGRVATATLTGTGSRRGESARLGVEELQTPLRQCQEDWEIDPAKLVIERGTFGTVHRSVYDGQDVAGLLRHGMLFIVVGKVECSLVGRNAMHKLIDSKEHVTKNTSPNMKLLRHTTGKSSKPS